jgi:hypothetical protein
MFGRDQMFRSAAVRASLAALALTAMAGSAEAAPGKLGVSVDVGVPDGMNGSLIVRPLNFLQLHGGLGTNLISPGIRIGAALHLPTVVSPALAVDAGHYFTGDANAAMQLVGLDNPDEPLLREVGYDYANLHVGLHVGRQRVSFFLHAGWSVVRGKLRNTNEEIMATLDDGLTLEVKRDPVVTIITPSARLGLAFFF